MSKSSKIRFAIAFAIGIAAFILTILLTPFALIPGGDLALWPLKATRDILANIDPYSYSLLDWSVPYPLPAAIVVLPFTWLRDDVAGALFLSFSSFLMALALTRDGTYWRLWAFASHPYIESIITVQWGPLFLAAATYSFFLPVMMIKPHLGSHIPHIKVAIS